jgi:hypothetical protein
MDENTPTDSRKAALFLLVAGAALFGSQIWMMRSGNTYYPKVVGIGFMLLPMGLAGLIDPRVLAPNNARHTGTPGIGLVKLIAYVGFPLVIAAGLYLAIGLGEGWWMPEFVWNMFTQV